jgi:hypothetical protein
MTIPFYSNTQQHKCYRKSRVLLIKIISLTATFGWDSTLKNIQRKLQKMQKLPTFSLKRAIFMYCDTVVRRGSVVGIATGKGLDNWGVAVRVPVWWRISTSHRSDRFWGLYNFLSNGCRGIFPRGLSGRGIKLTIHLQLVPRWRKRGTHPLPPTPWRRSA